MNLLATHDLIQICKLCRTYGPELMTVAVMIYDKLHSIRLGISEGAVVLKEAYFF